MTPRVFDDAIALSRRLADELQDEAWIDEEFNDVDAEQLNPPPGFELWPDSNNGSSPKPSANGNTRKHREGATIDDFYAYMPDHRYLFAPTRQMWPSSSVNARVEPVDVDGRLVKPAAWLDANKPVEQMTWAPGLGMVIRDRLIDDGGWIDHTGATCFNLYRPPQLAVGEASQAGLWIDHVRFTYPADADHIIAWLAHRVQRPDEKINHALVLGGAQGIGKDSLLEPVKYAIGPWNFAEASPTHIVGRFNGYVKSVILRISEARDLGEVDRFAFYERTKTLMASPPDVLRVDEKHIREYYVLNVCGVVVTTNHKTDGIHLQADDRRHYVAWSDCTRDEFDGEYWTALWRWYRAGGFRHVAAFLAHYDLSTFDAKAPPPKTAAFWDIVDANRAPEDAELADVLDALGKPEAITLDEVADRAAASFAAWLRDRKNRRQIPHRMDTAGYVPVRSDTKDGLWKIGHRRQVVYVRSDLTVPERVSAAQMLVTAGFK